MTRFSVWNGRGPFRSSTRPPADHHHPTGRRKATTESGTAAHRTHARRWRDDTGMTVLEGVVALSLFSIVALAVAQGVAGGARVVTRSQGQDASATILAGELDRVRALSWTQATTTGNGGVLNASSTRTVDGLTYTVTTTVTDVCPNAATGAPACPATSAQTSTPANPFSATGIALTSPTAQMHRTVSVAVARTGASSGETPPTLTGSTDVAPTQNVIAPFLRVSVADAGNAKRLGAFPVSVLRNGAAVATITTDAFGNATYTLPSASDVSATWTVDSGDTTTPAASGPVTVTPTTTDEGGALLNVQRKATVSLAMQFPADAGSASGWAGKEYRINPVATYLRLGTHTDYNQACIWFFGWYCTGYAGPTVLWTDSNVAAAAIPLSDIGAVAGDTITIDSAGGFCGAAFNCNHHAMAGVFSSSNVLNTICTSGNAGCPNPPLRVPGAVGPPKIPGGATATAAVTPALWNDYFLGYRDAYLTNLIPDSTQDQQTDIPQDFLIRNDAGTAITPQVVVPAGAQYLYVTAIDTQYWDNSDDGDFRLRIQKFSGTVVNSTAQSVDPRATFLANRNTTCGLSSWTAFLNCFGTVPLDIWAWFNGSNRSTPDASPIDLAALGASAGDQIIVTRNGRFTDNVNAWGTKLSAMGGVVSSSPALNQTCRNAPSGQNCDYFNRVTGITGTGLTDMPTAPNYGFMYDFGFFGRYWYDPLQSNITGDFQVATDLPSTTLANQMGTTFMLPSGGRYLYVQAYEDKPIWWDNGNDTTQPFQVTVTVMKPAKGACVTVTLAGDGRGQIAADAKNFDVCKYGTVADNLPANVARVGTTNTFTVSGFEPSRPFFAGGTPGASGVTPAVAETAPPRIVASVTGYGYAPVVTTVSWPATGSATVAGSVSLNMATTATTRLIPFSGTNGARRLTLWGVSGIGRGAPLTVVPDPDSGTRSYWLPTGTWNVGAWQPDDGATAASATTASGTTTLGVS